MSDSVKELTNKLGMNSGKKKPKAEHHLKGRIFPFHTRTQERVKFTDDFNEIVGIIARCSVGKIPILEDISNEHLSNIMNRLDISSDILNEEVEDLFSVNFDLIKNPIMFQYFPVLMDTKKQKDESRGKALLGYYITKLLKLDENIVWKEYISNNNVTDLYESVYVECLPEIRNYKTLKDEFHFFNQEELVNRFTRDLAQLMKNEKIFLNDIGKLISYYFFYYILEQSFHLVSSKCNPIQLWFAYDKEKVTAGRDCVQKGYKIYSEVSRELLINNDLLDYLNILSNKEEYHSYEEIMRDEENLPNLGMNLLNFNSQFADSLDEDYSSEMDIHVQIKQLKKYLKINISNETAKRYRKSFDEFSGLTFIKSRGRLGYVLNATQELILLFVGVIIGDKDKILLNKLFKEFEIRGLYFDKQSRKEIISFFEDVNILEKLSDSGDAQYVKSIL
ncbi:DNA phosphorothioation-dependent restriction protein DptG [Carnobacterium maltaromaticum]|uniref:DNA phosphorothioation-dependent restriction protein DptG n=1 Tax=Carnobacterium maltaromaticum TaxID=2751 RepID=UPI0010727AB3|nr:DNA phosphorothioation-dependent restriction protein DptG [Carnobacterium maltaromaticum]TFJ76073.1 DNA phosphorothioation-dependent restriction protein DptG [Carnobacterium maltaromaticum]TFJ79014.1 DNA phosphorothioation-dependent restriction protein DptG [Carnobacterium maltaromaticum]